MIIQCTEKDREMLVSFLRKEPVYNTFILADIEDLGFDSSVQTVYAEVEEGECVGVYLCFYKNLLISCEENRTNVDFLEQLFGMFLPDVVMGKPADVRVAAWLLTDYRSETKGFYALEDDSGLEEASVQPEEARAEDAGEIFRFIQGIPELADMYTSEQMIEDRIRNGLGVHYVFREKGVIIAHGNSAARSSGTVMIGGVATAPEYRGRHLAGQIVSRLSRDILKEGKTPCLISLRGEEDNLYIRLGFRKIGDWAMLRNGGKRDEQ